MPTPLVLNGIIRVTLATRIPAHAQNGLNVLHYRVTSPGGMQLEQVPLAFYNRVVTQYVGWLPTVAQFVGVSVSKVATAAPFGPLTFAAGPFYYVFPQAGHASTGVIPLQASGLIRLTTPGDDQMVEPVPPGHGRVYVPFPALTSYNEGTATLNTMGRTRLESIRAVLGPTLVLTGGASLQLVIKRTKGNDPVVPGGPTPPPTLLGYTNVTAMTSLGAIATQRRRGDFGRLNAAFGGVI